MDTPPTDSPPTTSPTYRLADTLLQGRLRAFVKERRAKDIAWRRIALDLWKETDGEIDITPETLRQWFDEKKPEAVA